MHKLEQLPPTPVEILNNAYRIAKEEGLKYVYTGNAREMNLGYKMPFMQLHCCGQTGLPGSINTITGGKCNKCGTKN